MNILVAIPVFGNVVTPLQLFGYGIAVVHVFYYKRLRAQVEAENAKRKSDEEDEALRQLELKKEVGKSHPPYKIKHYPSSHLSIAPSLLSFV
jgi:hypothetical protein